MSENENKPADQSPTDDQADKLVLNSPDEAKTVKDYLLWAGVIVLAVLTVYSPVLRGRFIWDDDRHVEKSMALRMGAEGLQKIWFAPASVLIPQYYPLTHTTYWIEYQLFGGEDGRIEPTVFHVTNTLLHAAGAILLWFILRQLKVPGAWVAAAIFAVHPIEAESVAWISERKNVLSGALVFGAMLVYLRTFGIGRGSGFRIQGSGKTEDAEFPWNEYLGALALFAGAMLSKTVACAMPAVVLLLIWWKGEPRDPKWRRWALLGTIPFFVLGLALAYVTIHMERSFVRAEGADWDLLWTQRILIAGRAIWFYARKILVPVNLTFIYPRWNVDAGQLVQWLYPIAVIAVLAVLFALRKRIGRGPIAAALIFCGTLVPALGFFNVYPMRYSFVADHFQYLAGAALITAVVAAVAKALERMQPRTSETGEPRPMPYVLSAVVLAVLTFLTFQRSGVFTGMVPLFRDVVAKNPGSWMANYNLGTALMAEASRTDEYEQPQIESMRDEAVARFETAVKLRPDHDRALNNWGLILLNRGKVDEAVEKFNEALKIAPKNISSLTNLARAMQRQKKYDQAMKLYRQALELAETDRTMTRGERAANQSTLQQFLAETYGAMGDVKQALGAFTHAVQLNSNNLEARLELGELLVRQNMLAEAATQYRAILRANPSHVPARVREAQLQIRVNNLRPAQANLDIAVRINPLAPQLQETVKIWSDAVEARLATTRAAATRPATTQAATQPSADIIARIDRLLREDITRMPATQPATTQAAPIGTTTLPSSIN